MSFRSSLASVKCAFDRKFSTNYCTAGQFLLQLHFFKDS